MFKKTINYIMTEFEFSLGSRLNLFALLLPLVLMAILYYIGEPYIKQIMSDPIGYMDGEVWYGFGSNLGVLIWSCSAAISMFSGWLLYSNGGNKSSSQFLILLGALSLVLSLDDFFLLHDNIFPYFGVDEHVVFLFYAISGVYILAKYISVISQTDNILFIIGGGLFCISILLDIIPPSPFLGFLEDAAKFTGICSWGYYLVITSRKFVLLNVFIVNKK